MKDKAVSLTTDLKIAKKLIRLNSALADKKFLTAEKVKN